MTSHWEAQREEILSLKSIYCSPGECSLLGFSFDELEEDDKTDRVPPAPVPQGQISLVVRLTVPGVNLEELEEEEVAVSVTFKLGASYPVESPLISISSDRFNEENLLEMERRAIAYSQTLAPEPCLYSVLEWLKDSIFEMVASNPSCLLQYPTTACSHTGISKMMSHRPKTEPRATNLAAKPSKSKTHSEHQSVCIARIDHMRNEVKYFKTLRSWASELEICGKIVNAGLHAIYVILVGSTNRLSEFLRRWKTQNVDVDSQGKPCKEKLISTLCQQRLYDPLPTWQRSVRLRPLRSQERKEGL